MVRSLATILQSDQDDTDATYERRVAMRMLGRDCGRDLMPRTTFSCENLTLKQWA